MKMQSEMEPALGDIAVIVPAHNAEATIGRALAALERQQLDRPFELVVVDDCSTDATATIAEEWGARVVRTSHQQGPGAARNAGVAATSAQLLAFTDADCEPAPAWLRHGVAALEEGAELVTGPIQPVREPGPFDRTLGVGGPSPLFESANLFATRTLFDRVGGFQRPPRLAISVESGHFGEDAVFGWRAVRSGARPTFAPEALVRHAVFARGPGAYIVERWRLRFFPMLIRELPELRAKLPGGVFLSRRTARFDLAVSGVLCAAATRRILPLAAAIPYYRRDLGGQPWRRSVVRRNVPLLAGDLVGLAALIQGSIVHRRPLL
jgi:glycosyltransferase involved in cell wall biosynthesis